MAATMAGAPDLSLPQPHTCWADLKAAYRFFDPPKVTPKAIQSVPRRPVRAACATRPRVLAIQDGSELDSTRHRSVEGLGFVGGGLGRGLLPHSTLAMTMDGPVRGVLHPIGWKRTQTPKDETRRPRQARKTEAGVWAESMRAVGILGPNTRVIHVADRGGDNFETLQAALEIDGGFRIRAKHNRSLHGPDERLWPFLQRQPVAGTRDITGPARRAHGSTPAPPARIARLEVRYALVTLSPPTNDPRFTQPISVWAVPVIEANPPAGVEPVEWMLLTREPVHTVAAANAWVDAYPYRWRIEEWHKVEKTGCRLEAAQLKSAEGLIRLAALTAMVAIPRLQLRDLAQGELAGSDTNEASSRQDPAALSAVVPAEWICVVRTLAGGHPDELTPQAFWRTLAQPGGFIGRTGDGLPGGQAIWKGWTQVRFLVQGFKIHQTLSSRSCG